MIGLGRIISSTCAQVLLLGDKVRVLGSAATFCFISTVLPQQQDPEATMAPVNLISTQAQAFWTESIDKEETTRLSWHAKRQSGNTESKQMEVAAL